MGQNIEINILLVMLDSYLLTDKHCCCFDSEGSNFICYFDTIYSVHFYCIDLNFASWCHK
jgi:hypothetical protein